LKPPKFIFLSSSSKGKNLEYYDLNSDGFFVGSWAGLFARRLKAFNPELDISIWIMEPVVDRALRKKVFNLDGIIWPYRGVLIKNVFSFSMLLSIIKLSFKYNIILHYHSLFDRFILIRYFLPRNVKIVLSHHGGVPPLKCTLKDLFFRITFRKASAITYLSSSARDYLRRIKIHENKIHFLPVGADFHIFRPSDKNAARKKLGLDPGTIYGIYVGAFYRLKSVDIILDIFNQLKAKYNFKVIFVGGEENKGNDLYKEVRDSGCPYFGRQVWTDMPDFYNAADFYIHPAFNPQFGGLDVTWIEALACNIPILSPQLKYLDFDYSELGAAIDSPKEAIEKTEFMIKNHMNFKNCRELAKCHLDANTAIMKKLTAIYKDIEKPC
jgi:glycosyltransferase involved in cell wall biosynthesis